MIKSKNLKLVGRRAFRDIQKKAIIKVLKGKKITYGRMLEKKGWKRGMKVK